MADLTPLPADLPEDWTNEQIVAPNGADVGLSEQHGYNYQSKQINDTQRAVNAHVADRKNPHGVTAAQVGLGNVPNVGTNDQTPTYTAASSLTALTSGEKLSAAFGKLAKAVGDLISHIASRANPHGVTAAQAGALPTAGGTITGALNLNGLTKYYNNEIANKDWVQSNSVSKAEKGAANGVATLNPSGKIPETQLQFDRLLAASARAPSGFGASIRSNNSVYYKYGKIVYITVAILFYTSSEVPFLHAEIYNVPPLAASLNHSIGVETIPTGGFIMNTNVRFAQNGGNPTIDVRRNDGYDFPHSVEYSVNFSFMYMSG